MEGGEVCKWQTPRRLLCGARRESGGRESREKGMRLRGTWEDVVIGVCENGEGDGVEGQRPHPFGEAQCIQQGMEGGEEVVSWGNCL